MNTNKLKVEVWSDVVCPFCYIGKRHYEIALQDFPHKDEIELEFKSFQLDPDFVQNPDEKLDLAEALAKKYGRSVEEMKAMQNQIVATAKNVGLNYDFDKAVRFNTFNAHRVAKMAEEKGIGNEMEEALFKAYFEEGKDLGNTETLTQLAMEVGLSKEEVEKALTDDDYAFMVNRELREATQLGISSVPFFVFDRKYAVQGAQPPQAFAQTLEAAYKEWKAAQPTVFKSVSEGPSCDLDGNCN